MKPFLSLCLLAALPLLSACSSQEAEPSILDNPPLREKQSRLMTWEVLSANRHATRVAVIMKDAKAPLQHHQLARSVSYLVGECMRTSVLPDQPNEAAAVDAESRCVATLVNQTLVQSGADRAYEVSLAAKSADPTWLIRVVPTYVSID